MSKVKPIPDFITRDNNHEVTGTLHAVLPINQWSEKFSTREFVLECVTEYQGDTYYNYPKFQLINHRCDLPDVHNFGDLIKVHFNIRGTIKKDNLGNITAVYTQFDVYRIESISKAPIFNNEQRHQSDAEYAASQGQEIDDLPF